jgi:hypothetical protein
LFFIFQPFKAAKQKCGEISLARNVNDLAEERNVEMNAETFLTGSIKPETETRVVALTDPRNLETELRVVALTDPIRNEIRVVTLTDSINPETEIRVVTLTDPIKNEFLGRAGPISGSFCRRNRVRSQADLFLTTTTGWKDGSTRFLKIRMKWRRIRQTQLSELSNIELAMDMIWSRFRFRRDFTNETSKIGDSSKLTEAD